MKVLHVILILLVATLAGVSGEAKQFSPEVVRFIMRCTRDNSQNFEKTERWLRAEKIDVGSKDQMWEILSGLVWNKDKRRGRVLAMKIENRKLRKAVIDHYDELDKLNKWGSSFCLQM